MSTKDEKVVVLDGDGGCIKLYDTTRVAQLSHGDERQRFEVGDNVDVTGGRR